MPFETRVDGYRSDELYVLHHVSFDDNAVVSTRVRRVTEHLSSYISNGLQQQKRALRNALATQQYRISQMHKSTSRCRQKCAGVPHSSEAISTANRAIPLHA